MRKLLMADPEFSPGSEHTAHALMMNNTPKAWTYDSELYLVKAGTKYASSGIIPFTLAAGASRTIDFPITAPDIEGTYKVYLDIYVAGELIAAYTATEDVVIAAAPPARVWPSEYYDPNPTGYRWVLLSGTFFDSPVPKLLTTKPGRYVEYWLAEPILCNKVHIWDLDWYSKCYSNSKLSFDLYYGGAWHNIFSGSLPNLRALYGRDPEDWIPHEISFPQQLVSKARVKANSITCDRFYMYGFQFYRSG